MESFSIPQTLHQVLYNQDFFLLFFSLNGFLNQFYMSVVLCLDDTSSIMPVYIGNPIFYILFLFVVFCLSFISDLNFECREDPIYFFSSCHIAGVQLMDST